MGVVLKELSDKIKPSESAASIKILEADKKSLSDVWMHFD